MDIAAGRFTAASPGEAVVFLIGMRINKLRAVRQWVPVMRAARAMVRELQAEPDGPLLASTIVMGSGDPRQHLFIQHWRSFDELESWANDADRRHRPAQAAFFRRTAYNGDVGIWHETYRVPVEGQEAIYANMPPIGLAAATGLVPLSAASRARERLDGGGTDLPSP